MKKCDICQKKSANVDSTSDFTGISCSKESTFNGSFFKWTDPVKMILSNNICDKCVVDMLEKGMVEA